MLTLAFALAVLAQAPANLMGGPIDTRSAASGLEPAVRALLVAQPQPAWIGYAVPSLGGNNCCFDSVETGSANGWCCGGCRLEGRHGAFHPTSRMQPAGPIPLEQPRVLHVLLRIEQGRISQVRGFSAGCALDAGGRPVHWLTDVRPADGAALLVALAASPARLPVEASFDDNQALAALAQLDEPSVDGALERLATTGPQESRKQAVFWLGQGRGRAGYQALVRILHGDASDALREHAAFSLSQSDVPEAVDAIIEAARHDRSEHVRGQALFWLSQKAGAKAAAAITDAIRDDPETGVKEQAVFALSQLPADEGIPHLIRLARSHGNPAVREKAMFWLGQSEDERALRFFEEVLAR